MQKCQDALKVSSLHLVWRFGILTLFVRKMIKRLEDLAQDSSAVKPHVIPQMEALNNFMAELVNFGISVR